MKSSNLLSIFKNLSLALPGMFIAAPFFSTYLYMGSGKELLKYLNTRFGVNEKKRNKNILWFTDSLTDLNGVSTTLQKIGWLSHQRGYNIRIAASVSDEEREDGIPPNVMNIPAIYMFPLPYYDEYIMKIPSILKALKMVYEFEPDEIYISTPGPIGCLGIIVAKLLSIPCVGIYHTDFVSQASQIDPGESSLIETLEILDRWFYSLVDEIQISTSEYFSILERRGLDRKKMQIFQKGVDSDMFHPKLSGKRIMAEEFRVEPGINLLYVGRVSKDKNLDFLMEVYRRLSLKHDDLNLLIVGNGPYLNDLREMMKDYRRIVFTDRVRQDMLPDLYSGADLFLFPSTTDTFGNVVAEAQACGCPAIVSNIGGPQEIVQHGITGRILPISDPDIWVNEINELLAMMGTDPLVYQRMKDTARIHAHDRYDWNVTLERITSIAGNGKNGNGIKEEQLSEWMKMPIQAVE